MHYLLLTLALMPGYQGENIQHPLTNITGEVTDSLEKLFSDYQEWRLTAYPEWASNQDIPGYSHLVEDFSMEAIRAKADICKQFLDRSKKLEAENTMTRSYQNYFEAEILPCVEGLTYKGYLLPPVNNMENVAVDYPDLVRKAALDSVKGYEDLLTRLTKLPAMLRQITSLLRQGIKEQVTYAKESLSQVDTSFERLQVDPEDSIFFSRFRDMSGSLGRRVVNRIQTSAFNLTKNEILPAFLELQNFLRYEYVPRVRSGPGISNIPDGDKFYLAAMKFHLGSDMSPEEVHQIGKEEVSRLKEGAIKVIEELGVNKTFRQFTDYLLSEPSQKFSSKQEALDMYRYRISEINEKLPTMFPKDILTEEALTVRVQEGITSATAYYDNGVFYARLEPLNSQTRFEGMTLTLHEANPGHHLQDAVTKSQRNVPEFMKYPMFHRYSEIPSRFGMPTVSTEGWGLYSEFLGHEMGLFDQDKLAEFGFFSFNLLRACRLVVDTGLHAMNWTRDEAVTFMMENTPAARHVVESEVDRYITLPAQALAYKIGEQNIRKVRVEAGERLGAEFDLREFHRTVIQCQGPLPVLETCVDTWVRGPGQSQKPLVSSEGGVSGAERTGVVTSLLVMIAAMVRGVQI